MSTLRIPNDIRNALVTLTANRYQINDPLARLWIHDIEEKGTQSIYFEQVKPVVLDFCGPILSVIMPAIQRLIAAAVAAGIAQSRTINDEDYGTDIGPDGIPIRGDDEAEAILRHVDDPDGEKDTFLNPKIGGVWPPQ